jgi:hypothetical protein
LDWTGGRAGASCDILLQMPTNNAVQRLSKVLDRLDRKLAAARLAAAAADERLAQAEAARAAAADSLAQARAALTAPEPEPRRYFTRDEIAQAQARGR